MSTSEAATDLFDLPGRAVLFCCPRIVTADEPSPPEWDAIPGARGCTGEANGFREQFREFSRRGVQVFGITSQTTADQQDVRERLKLPYDLLSDVRLVFARALRLPTFRFGTTAYLRGITLFCINGEILKAFAPDEAPDQNAREVIAWLDENKAVLRGGGRQG